MSWGLAAVVFAVTDESLGIRDSLALGWQKVGAFIWFFSIAGYIIFGGFLLLIVPGVIFLVWFAFGQFILAREDLRGMDALLKSKEYVRGYWPDVFLRLFLIWIASGVVGIVPCIGILFTVAFMPFMMIFIFLIYEDLKAAKGDIAYHSSTGEKFKWIGAGTLGYLIIPAFILLLLGVSLSIPLLLLKGLLNQTAREMIMIPAQFWK
ncbi:MAG: hypothetical protein EPN25_08115 [Nitrospirae bacterium]|nr:MAG: hypothetical protein EPN25_08115 [Nitrospirota bacterium]